MHIKVFSHHRWAEVKTYINLQLGNFHITIGAEVKTTISAQYDI
jgi:hypothetical protein